MQVEIRLLSPSGGAIDGADGKKLRQVLEELRKIAHSLEFPKAPDPPLVTLSPPPGDGNDHPKPEAPKVGGPS